MPTSRREIANKLMGSQFTRIRCIGAIAHHRSYFGDDDSKRDLARLRYPVLKRMVVDILLDPHRREGDEGGDDPVAEDRESEVRAVLARRIVAFYRDFTIPDARYWIWGTEVGRHVGGRLRDDDE